MQSGSSDAVPSGIDDLIQYVRALERRIASLEQRLSGAPLENSAVTANEAPAAALPSEGRSIEETVNAAPVLGRALLGIAGAYLLRALTEFGALPHVAGVTLGVLYAAVWLILAARTATDRTFVVAMHCLTSVLILAPLLWEATLRFSVLPPWVTAAVLTLFSVFGLAISWRKNLAIIVWITTLAGVGLAAALLVATGDLVPFTTALLAIAAAIEFSACRDHWVGERWAAAIVVDLSVLLLTFLAGRPGGVPDGYKPVGLPAVVGIQIALLVVYLVSTTIRTLIRRLDFTFFETVQALAAFLLAVVGSLHVTSGGRAAFWITGAFALVSGVVCYVLSFVFLERQTERHRNFYTYSTFALLLVLTGSWILLSDAALAAVWCGLALGSLWLGGHYGKGTLRLHGALYLALGTLVTGLGSLVISHLLGEGATWEAPAAAVWVSAAAALMAYPVAVWTARPENDHWVERLSLSVVSIHWAALIAWAGAVAVLFALSGYNGEDKAAIAAAGRTAVLTLLGVGLAWYGKRLQRGELSWLVFPVMLLAGYRILLRDINLGHTLALFVSLLLYGGALVVLPRIWARKKTQVREAA